jgi:hypothetical protein
MAIGFFIGQIARDALISGPREIHENRKVRPAPGAQANKSDQNDQTGDGVAIRNLGSREKLRGAACYLVSLIVHICCIGLE